MVWLRSSMYVYVHLVAQMVHALATTAATTTVTTYPTPDLPLGDVNVVVVTDVHSWVAGHKDQNPSAADYGDVISFVEHLKAYGESKDKDVWFVMNGDWIDGTGLAMNGDPSKLIPILEKMPFDAMNVGNHELYRSDVIEYMTRSGGLVEWFGKRYLSTNVLHTDTMHTIGQSYRILNGKDSNVLTFGFLYDMTNAAPTVTVQSVEDTVNQKWFKTVLSDTESFDAILVLAHMDVRDDLCKVILSHIRAHTGEDTPVQFVTGHTHNRDYEVFDKASTSFEAGKYLDTIGFVSFPTRATKQRDSTVAASEMATEMNLTSRDDSQDSKLFCYRYLDANVPTLIETLGLSAETFPTENGVEQSEFILRVQIEMGLKQEIGCAPDTYYKDRSLQAKNSLWRLFKENVVPDRFSGNQAVVFGNGAWRYDLFKGAVQVDDALAISPFNNTMWIWENSIPTDVLLALNETLNNLTPMWKSKLPQYILAPAEPIVQTTDTNYSLIVDEFEMDVVKSYLQTVYSDHFGHNTTLPESQIMKDCTTSSFWIDYFLENSHTCKKHTIKKPPIGTFSFDPSTVSNGAGFSNTNFDADMARYLFVAMAIFAMGILGSIAVWQKSVLFRHHVAFQEFQTLEAIREYTDNDEMYGVEDGELI